jgi:hypothetical protein
MEITEGNEFVRHTDPETSHEAVHNEADWEAIRISLLRSYAWAAANARNGLTDEEAMERAGYSLIEDGHRRRCSDLRGNKDFQGRSVPLIMPVEENGELVKRAGRTGRARMVCTITAAGVDKLDEVDGVT